MNKHDFYMTLGAKAGLCLDGEQGILSGTSNGFRINVLSSSRKLIITVAAIKGMVYPTPEEASKILDNCAVSSVRTQGKVLYITTSSFSSNVTGAEKAASTINDITKALSENGYVDDSENCEVYMNLQGKNVALTYGDGVITRYILGFLGAAIGIAIGGVIIVWLHSIHAIFAMMVTISLMLLLVVGGFEFFNGPRTVKGLVMLFIMLIVAVEIFVRLKSASYAVYCVDMAADTLDMFSRLLPELNINEYIQIDRQTIGSIFWMLPSIFNASGDFFKDLVFGYLEAIIVFFLAYKSYKLGNKSIFSYLGWLWQAIFHR